MAKADRERAEVFLAWLHQAGEEERIERLLALSDEERRRLSPEVGKAWREATKEGDRRGRWPLDVAVAGVCSWSHARRLRASEIGWGYWQEDSDELFRIFDGRRADWLPRWVEQELAERTAACWPLVRRLVRSGACPRPESDGYIVHMVESRLGSWGGEQPLAESVREDPELLEYEIWRVFEVDPPDGELFRWDETHWEGRGADRSWGRALVQLANEGVIDRQRLLRATLGTLQSGIQLRDTAFHLRLHDRLEPTLEERRQLSGAYLDLLEHRVDAVAKFALGNLRLLADRGVVDGAELLKRLPGALRRATLGPAKSALTLARRVVRDDSSLAASAAWAALEGLSHPKPQIHERVLELLTELSLADESELAANLEKRLALIAPSQQEAARGLIEAWGSPSEMVTGEEPAEDLEALAVALRSLDPSIQQLVDSEELLEAVLEGRDPPAFVPRPAELPWLDPEQRVSPVESFDELVDLLLALLEDAADAVDYERAIDGCSRLLLNPPEDLEERTAALLQRSCTVHDEGASTLAELAAAVVLVWLQGAPLERREGWGRSESLDPESFLEERLGEVLERSRLVSLPMLALPTHRSGVIDPLELVRRYLLYLDAGEQVGHHDLIQALLRLAPDRRPEALGLAVELPGEEGSLLRFALGSDEERPESSGFWMSRLGRGAGDCRWALWLAAARARSPLGKVEALAATPIGREPFAVSPTQYRVAIVMKKVPFTTKREPQARIELEPAGKLGELADRPLVLLARSLPAWSNADARHRHLVWPLDPQAALLSGAKNFCDRLFRPASAFTPTATYLEPLFDPVHPFSEIVRVVVALALVGQDADARSMAMELVLEAVRDGRCRGDELGLIYAELWREPGLVKLGRLGGALDEMARHGALCRMAGLRVLEPMLATMTEPPRDLHHLLEPYRESLHALGREARIELRPLLEGTRGKSKTARLARSILELSPEPELAARTRREAGHELLSRRLELARGWQARRSS